MANNPDQELAAETSQKHPGGRPSTYDPAYCQKVIDLGADGMSPEQISAEIDIPRTTMLSWAESYPEFSTALTRAKELEMAWWENTAQRALFADKFQNAVWAKSVAARFRDKYTEKAQIEHSGPNGKPMQSVTRIELVAPTADDISSG